MGRSLPLSLYASQSVKSLQRKFRLTDNFTNKSDMDRFLWDSMDKSQRDEWIDEHKRIDNFHNDLGVHSLFILDPYYPTLLKEIPDPPMVLFVKGDLDILASDWWGIVGTRKASPLSLEATKELVLRLLPPSVGVASGLALGIDRIAMQTSMDAGRPTLGVLGTSIEKEYPFSNQDLYKKLKKSPMGILISEYLPNTGYSKWTFPMRNRIITGLSKKVFLMETPQKSGAMSSAYSAVDQNRDVIVFDHPYLYDNQGGKSLLEDGAMRLEWNDILSGSIVYHLHYDREKIIQEIGKFRMDSLIPSMDGMEEWELRGKLLKEEINCHIKYLGDNLYIFYRNNPKDGVTTRKEIA